LPKGTVQGDFDELFKGLKLQEVHLVHDKETGEAKGYGYAMFHDQESLQTALGMDGVLLNGQRIKIDMKKPSNRNRGQQGMRGGRNDFGGGAFNSRQNNRYDQQQGERRTYANRPVPDVPPFTAYVGNLPEEAVESDLDTMFHGLDLVKVHLVIDRETQRHKGYGYAEFATKDSLVRALSLDGAAWMSKTLKVNVHEPRQRFGDRGGFQNNGAGGGQRFDQGAGGGQRFDQGAAGGQRFDQGAGGGRFDQGGRFSRGGEGFADRRGNRPMQPRPVEEPAPIDDGKERPKLVLQKKSEGGASSEATKLAQPSSSSKPSPFGNAKPVDTASKLRQLDDEKKAADAKKAAEKKALEVAEGKAESGEAKAQ
jgi:translation initiation factor 4B